MILKSTWLGLAANAETRDIFSSEGAIKTFENTTNPDKQLSKISNTVSATSSVCRHRNTPLKHIGAEELVYLSTKCHYENLKKKDKRFYKLTWTSKFVVIAEACLYIYGDDRSSKYEEAFSMSECNRVSVSDEDPCEIYLEFGAQKLKSHIFRCETQMSTERWMTLLKEAMNKTQDAVYSVEATIYKNRGKY
ncbi:uncharacterized protein LOC128221258 [Mya arenaria]|uniref:uncharacterized protein LOC128221258 n=1 Tax=Mya arenaria TaxID=6604 RepID=UPI0022E52278|nr:uncharacterized protein LOC128221258 [Mya arenaria]